MREQSRIFERYVDQRIRVRYSETDRMAIVYHTNYIVWFEIGRTEFCREAGLPYRQMEEEGVFIPVTEVECRFRRPAHYDDDILIRTRMGDVGSRGLTFFYEIGAGQTGALLAEGRTRHVFTNAVKKTIPIPEKIRETFARFAGQEPAESLRASAAATSGGTRAETLPPRRATSLTRREEM